MSTAVDMKTWASVASILMPRERLRPSEWSERYRILKPGTTPQPGRFRCWPWQRPIMDAVVDFPDRDGALVQKPSQFGISECIVSVVGWIVEQQPGPVLYLLPTDKEAKEFEKDRFSYMIESAPRLKERFFLTRQLGETMESKEFIGGRLRIYGHGSPTKLKAHPYRYVVADELNEMGAFPGQGDAFSMARARTEAYHGQSFIWGQSTPTLETEGITPLMEALTDQRRLMLACPHCQKHQWLKMAQVRITERRADSARYECEACGRRITDGERAAAVEAATFEPMRADGLDDTPFVGFYLSRLYDPLLPITDIAERYLGCRNEGQLQVFYNHALGEGYTQASRPIKEQDIAARATREPNEPLPKGTRFLTAGVDVQQGQVFYLDVSAWLDDGKKILVDFPKLQGWDRLRGYLRAFKQSDGEREFGIRLIGIDAEYETKKVYEFCKQNSDIAVPCWYGNVSQGAFSQVVQRKQHGTYVHILKREHWMERAHGRFVGTEDSAGVELPITVSDDYRNHFLANVRTEHVAEYGRRKVVWLKPDKGAADHWMHAAAYSEYAATLLGLDTIEGPAHKVETIRDALNRQRPEITGRKGWVRRDYRKRTREGRWIER